MLYTVSSTKTAGKNQRFWVFLKKIPIQNDMQSFSGEEQQSRDPLPRVKVTVF